MLTSKCNYLLIDLDEHLTKFSNLAVICLEVFRWESLQDTCPRLRGDHRIHDDPNGDYLQKSLVILSFISDMDREGSEIYQKTHFFDIEYYLLFNLSLSLNCVFLMNAFFSAPNFRAPIIYLFCFQGKGN